MSASEVCQWVEYELALRAGNHSAQLGWIERQIAMAEHLEERTGVGMPYHKMALLWNKVLLLNARQKREREDA